MKFLLAIIPSIGICCFICGLSNSFRKEINKLLNVKFENMDNLSEQTNNPTLSEDLFNSGSQVFDNVQKNQQEVFHDFQQISEENFSDESDDDLSFDIF